MRGRIVSRQGPNDKNKKLDLNNLKIAFPCKVPWESMKQVVSDSDRARFCGQCKQSVFNIADMTQAEAQKLINGTTGRLCVQLYKREDGTVMTRDCAPPKKDSGPFMPEMRGMLVMPIKPKQEPKKPSRNDPRRQEDL